jgi:hypothetical protein
MQHASVRFLILSVMVMLAACVSAPPSPTPEPIPTNTAVPTNTPNPTSTSTPPPIATEEVASATEELAVDGTPVSTIEPLIVTDLVVPIRIDLPEGWLTGSSAVASEVGEEFIGTALMLDEGLGVPFLPFTIYRGPVTGGTGYITVVWGFQNITTATYGLQEQAQIDLRGDGVRLLNIAVLEAGCNIGFDVDREFAIGNTLGAGAYFAANNCPAPEGSTVRPPDVKGWFLVTQQNGINFAFYAYTEPGEAMDGEALNELQAIMDSIVFDMSLLPERLAVTEEAQP